MLMFYANVLTSHDYCHNSHEKSSGLDEVLSFG